MGFLLFLAVISGCLVWGKKNSCPWTVHGYCLDASSPPSSADLSFGRGCGAAATAPVDVSRRKKRELFLYKCVVKDLMHGKNS
jgi:hypothetical protein